MAALSRVMRPIRPHLSTLALAAGVSLLTFLAAMTNGYFLVRGGLAVSHLSGDVARLSHDLALGVPDPQHLIHLSLIVPGFLLGALLSGYFMHSRSITLRAPYGRGLIAVGALLILAAVSPSLQLTYASAACACGMQNALGSTFRGMVIRTTHITGVATDLGALVGMRLAGHHIDTGKLLLHVAVLCCFAAGAFLGGLCADYGPLLALLGVVYVLLGLAYYVMVYRRAHRVITH